MAVVSTGFIEKTSNGGAIDRPIGAMSENVFHTIQIDENTTKVLALKSIIDNYLDMAENALFIHRGSEAPTNPEHVGLWIKIDSTDNNAQEGN